MKKQSKHTTENQLFANLEKYHSIDVDEDWNIVKNRIGFQKTRRINIIWRAAAIAILLLSFGFLTNRFLIDSPTQILAFSGEFKKEIALPDGSLVFLNKKSTLTYPDKFHRNHREVKLSGEGFFEVASNTEKPFLVNVKYRAIVEVLGTSFNINTTENSRSINVQVVEGKVAFYVSGENVEREILLKDDQAKMLNGEIIKETSMDKNFLSWKTGKLVFVQDRIPDVVKTLQNYYDRLIILQGSENNDLTFTSIIDNQDLDSVLEELRLVIGLSYSIEEDKILIQMPE